MFCEPLHYIFKFIDMFLSCHSSVCEPINLYYTWDDTWQLRLARPRDSLWLLNKDIQKYSNKTQNTPFTPWVKIVARHLIMFYFVQNLIIAPRFIDIGWSILVGVWIIKINRAFICTFYTEDPLVQ